MADQRKGGIAWTEETWNPIRGCSKVSEECRNCYAMWVAATRMSKPGQAYHGIAELTPTGQARWTGTLATVEAKLDEPLRWRRPRLIFVNSMSDLFHESLAWEQIDAIVGIMALATQHTYQVLTKRPGRMAAYLRGLAARPSIVAAVLNRKALGDPDYPMVPTLPVPDAFTRYWPLPNVWWGASIGTEDAAQERRDDVIACRPHAAVLWLSVEPLLEPVNITPYIFRRITTGTVDFPGRDVNGGIDWVVVGGESDTRGGEARPMKAEWVRAIHERCYENGVAFFFKQWGSWLPAGQTAADGSNLIDADGPIKLGKAAAGRRLDGETWDEWPAGFHGPVPAGKD